MYKLPLFYKIEENIIKKMKNEEKIFNKKEAVILTERKIYDLFYKEIFQNLNEKLKLDYIFIEDNRLEEAFKISYKIIDRKKDVIIGVGGGKILDLAKYISYISKIDLLSIPTTVANDGIASPIAVLKDKESLTRSIGAKVPTGILIDLEIIKKAPQQFIKAGIGDILSNYTALYDWELAFQTNNDKYFNDFAYLISKTAFNSVFYYENKNLKDEKFIKQVCEAIVLSGISMEIAGTSRPCSGSEHLFSHYIDYKYSKGNLHGYQVALGSVVSSYLQEKDFNKLIQFLKDLDINISPSNLKISKEEFLEAWFNCKKMRKNRYTILDKIELNEQKLLQIYDKIEKEFKK